MLKCPGHLLYKCPGLPGNEDLAVVYPGNPGIKVIIPYHGKLCHGVIVSIDSQSKNKKFIEVEFISASGKKIRSSYAPSDVIIIH